MTVCGKPKSTRGRGKGGRKKGGLGGDKSKWGVGGGKKAGKLPCPEIAYKNGEGHHQKPAHGGSEFKSGKSRIQCHTVVR